MKPSDDLASRLRRAFQIAFTIRRRTLATAALFAFLFSLVAIAQYAFVRHQLFGVARSETDAEASEIADVLGGSNGLNLREYRQAFFHASEWSLVGSDGTLIDAECSTPELLGPVALPNVKFDSPQTIVSEFGEPWRILARKLVGGNVVVGVRNPSSLISPDAMLARNSEKFGTAIGDATKVNPKTIDEDIEYAVIDSEGTARSAWGGIPLRCTNFITGAQSRSEVVLYGKPYLVAVRVATDAHKKPLATVLVPKEMTAEHRALRAQVDFNVFVAILAWLAVVGIAVTHFAREEIHRQRVHPSLAEARIQGEGQHVEFKRSLLWNREHNAEDGELRKAVLRTIVAFLNSGGGTLFIGIQDDGKPWGIGDDLECCGRSEDQFHLRLCDSVANLIGREFCNFIKSHIVNDPDSPPHRVCSVDVTGASRVAFLKSGNDSTFYVRNGPQTVKLSVRDSLIYTRNTGLRI